MGNLKFYFWATLYKAVLEIVYAYWVTPLFSYMHMVWNPNIYYFIWSYIIFFILLFLLPKGQRRPSKQLVQLFFFTTIVPILSFFWQAGQSHIYVFYITTCCLLLILFLRVGKSLRLPKLDLGYKNKAPIKIVNCLFVITALLLGLFTIKYGGIDTRAFFLDQVYDIRSEEKYTGIWAYLVNWMGKLFIPFCIIIYLHEKKKILFVLSALMQIYLYLSTGSKTVLFSVVLLICFYYLLKKDKWKLGLPKLYSAITVASTLIYLIGGYIMSIGLFPVRQLMIPAQISFAHYDFFSTNPKLYFSEGMIGKVLGLSSPYPVRSTYMVSNGDANWNTGFLGDAFANAGFIMMIIFTIVFGLILLYIDSVTIKTNDRYVYTALLTYGVVNLNDSSMLTALLTGGLGILLLLIYVYSSQSKAYPIKSNDTIHL